MTDLSSQFEENRAHLHAVAYRLLGSPSEAEDAVQETWLRLNRLSGVGSDGRSASSRAGSDGRSASSRAEARISAMTRFDNTVLPWFGMPRSLPV